MRDSGIYCNTATFFIQYGKETEFHNADGTTSPWIHWEDVCHIGIGCDNGNWASKEENLSKEIYEELKARQCPFPDHSLCLAFHHFFYTVFPDDIYQRWNLRKDGSIINETTAAKGKARGLQVGNFNSTRLVYKPDTCEDIASSSNFYCQTGIWNCAIFDPEQLTEVVNLTNSIPMKLKAVLAVMTLAKVEHGHARCLVLVPTLNDDDRTWTWKDERSW